MRIVWIGFHMEGKKALEEVSKNNKVVACISLNNASTKRSGVLDYSVIALQLGIPYHEVSHINDDESVELIRKYSPDLLVVLGWSQVLSKKVLEVPRIGTLGAHASLLPAYKGSAPINWALINGLSKSGNTLMWLNPGIDTGDIVDQISFEITLFDTCETLYLKVAEINSIMLLRTLEKIRLGNIFGKPQKITDEPILKRRKPSDGLIDFRQTSKKVYDFIRALTRPYPGAFTMLNGEQVFIWKASLLELNCQKQVGAVVSVIYSPSVEACGIVVGCLEGLIVLNEVEFCGKIFFGPELISEFPIGTKFKL
jgi:methionyl-tRNA formyltransferase